MYQSFKHNAMTSVAAIIPNTVPTAKYTNVKKLGLHLPPTSCDSPLPKQVDA